MKTSFKQEAEKRLLAGQRKAANYLNDKAKNWSKTGKILFLCTICGLFAAGILFNIVSLHKTEKHVLPAIRMPPPQDSLSSQYLLPLKK